MAAPSGKQENKYAIHEAAREGRIQAVESLVSTNPRLALFPDADARLPLHWAATCASVEIIKLLSSLPRFDPDVPDASGWTAAMIASSLPQNAGLEIVEFFATKDADFTLQSNTGASAVHLASSKQNLDVVRFLLKQGGSARVKDKRGQLPLHRAAAVGSVPVVKVLLENKSPVSTGDVDGMTALHHAISEGHGDVAVELLKAGAEAGRRDGEGRTALECAPDGKVVTFIRGWGEREGVDVE